MTKSAENAAGKRERKEIIQLSAVEIPYFDAAGVSRGTRTFTPGPTRNYPNIALLKEAVRRLQGRKRLGTASTKTRAEIAKSNKKPWRQKGTGRARAGTRRSPLWRGGGIIFGPKPRDYDYGLPKKQRRLAIRHALLSKLLDGEASAIERLPSSEPNASAVAGLLKTLGVRGRCLIGIGRGLGKGEVRNLVLSCRNLPGVQVLPIVEADALSLLACRHLLLTAEALEEIQAREQAVGVGR